MKNFSVKNKNLVKNNEKILKIQYMHKFSEQIIQIDVNLNIE